MLSLRAPRIQKTPVSKDLALRLGPFLERGLIQGVPTTWQLLLGQLEMAPYVLLPDAGDKARYEGAPLGNPLFRTPLIVSQIGWEHFRIGHGLHSSPETLELHLAYVYHEGMPTFDLMLVQTHAGGLTRLRRLFEAIEHGSSATGAHHRRLIDLVIPNATAYRKKFLEPGGWIDQAAAFDYPSLEASATFLRPEFTQLTSFVDYCIDTFAPSPSGQSPLELVREIAALGTRRIREKGR